MQPSSAQKGLRIVSIIQIILAILTIILGILAITASAAIMSNPSAVADVEQQAAAAGMTGTDVNAVIIGTGIGLIISGVIGFIVGFLGLRAAKDNQKIMPVWIFAIIGLVGGVINFITTVMSGTGMQNAFSMILNLALAALIFWLANTVKKEAGK